MLLIIDQEPCSPTSCEGSEEGAVQGPQPCTGHGWQSRDLVAPRSPEK